MKPISHYESACRTQMYIQLVPCQASINAQYLFFVSAPSLSNYSHRPTILVIVRLAALTYNCVLYCHLKLGTTLDNFQHYINTALGCHQVFAFEDIANEVKTLAKHMGLTVL